MNHCRKVILLWIVLGVGLTLSCRKGTGPRIQWIRTYGGAKDDRGLSVQQTRDGGFIIVGSTYSFGAGNKDIYVIKTDTKGNVIWEKTYGDNRYDEGYSIKQTRDGGYIITGEYKRGMCLMKIDSSGEIQWESEHIRNEGYCVQQTKDGGYIVKAARILIRTDANGKRIWKKKYEGEFVRETSEEEYITTGRYPYFLAADWPDIYLAKIDENGHLIWEKTYGGKYGDTGHSVRQTKD
jgi:hypothetical protein